MAAQIDPSAQRSPTLKRRHTLNFGRLQGSTETNTRARHLRFCRHMVVPLAIMPTTLALLYASLLFLPRTDHPSSPGALELGDLSFFPSTNATRLCPRAAICSEGVVEIVLLAVSRLSAYAIYGATFPPNSDKKASKIYGNTNCT